MQSYKITKTIDYNLSKEDYATIRGALNNNEETLKMLSPTTEKFKKTLYKFFPNKFPVGTKSNIEILILKLPAENPEPKVFCHLNIIEFNGFRFTKVLTLEDIDKRTGRPKKYINDTFSSTYEVRFN